MKRTHLKFNDPKDANALNSQKSSDHSDAVKAWIRKSKDLLNEVSTCSSVMLFPKVDACLRQQQINCVMRNVEEDMQMCEWAGVSFGDEFAYMLQKSLKVTKTFGDRSGRNLQGIQARGSLSSLERSMERSRITGLPTDGSTTWRRTRLRPLNREASG